MLSLTQIDKPIVFRIFRPDDEFTAHEPLVGSRRGSEDNSADDTIEASMAGNSKIEALRSVFLDDDQDESEIPPPPSTPTRLFLSSRPNEGARKVAGAAAYSRVNRVSILCF